MTVPLSSSSPRMPRPSPSQRASRTTRGDTNVTVTFEISDPISDKVLDSTSLRLNEAKEFSIDVSSVPRLKMKALVEAAPGESRKSDISVIAIWADPKFS